MTLIGVKTQDFASTGTPKLFMVRLRSLVIRNIKGCSPLARVLLLKQMTEMVASIGDQRGSERVANQVVFRPERYRGGDRRMKRPLVRQDIEFIEWTGKKE